MNLKTIFSKLKSHSSDLYQNFKENDSPGEKKHMNMIVIWIIIIAIIVLFCIRSFGSKDVSKTSEAKNSYNQYQTEAGYKTEQEYVNKMEEDLKGILEKISGAGNVSVRIYIDSTNEKILAADSKKQSETSEDKDGKKESSSSENGPIMSSGGSLGGNASPYVVQEKLPYPIGVVVVAEGAKNENVRNEIYEAVKALYGLAANRIKITY